MIFNSIDGKALNEVAMTDFVDFFNEHIFFKFMDSGRAGLQAGVIDLLDNSIKRSMLGFPDKSKKLLDRLASREFFDTMRDQYSRKIVDAFIMGGSVKMREAVFMCATDQRLFSVQ